ncbi:MAG: glycosyltransferase family 4 protein [Vicinamibacterales bacterium]
MSTVAVVTSSPPLVEGGHLVIARELVRALQEAGHDAGIVVTPQNRFGRQASAYVASWLTDVSETADGRPIDHVISLRYPSYAVRHPSHVCWLNHRMREYYDLWDRFSGTISWRNRIKEGVRRQAIHAVDRWLLTRNINRLYAQSRTIQGRLERWGGLGSEVLYPPAPVRDYRCDDYGDYLFVVSRLAPLKRIDLIMQALAEPNAWDIKCVIAGEGPELASLDQLRHKLGLEERVQLVGRLDEAGLLHHLSHCRAVVFAPYDEDYGFVTVEAFSAGKPVITCRDSGGPAEIVEDEASGFVTEPTPAGLAQAMRLLTDERLLAVRLGEAGRARAGALTWPDTIRHLLVS